MARSQDAALAHYAQVADEALVAARELFTAHLGARPALMKGGGDFATAADLAIEALLQERLHAATGIEVYGEEHGGSLNADACWVVDPIDGTSNYSSGNPNCAILVSLILNGQPVVACTDIPLMGMRVRAVDLRPRISGSVGVDLAFVAQGIYQAAVSFSPYVWDNAAGVLFARCAGARVSDLEGRPWQIDAAGAVAGTPTAHATALEVLQRVR